MTIFPTYQIFKLYVGMKHLKMPLNQVPSLSLSLRLFSQQLYKSRTRESCERDRYRNVSNIITAVQDCERREIERENEQIVRQRETERKSRKRGKETERDGSTCHRYYYNTIGKVYLGAGDKICRGIVERDKQIDNRGGEREIERCRRGQREQEGNSGG